MVSFSFAGHLYLQAPNSKRNWDLYRGVLSRRLYQQNHHGVWLHQMFYNSSILKSVRAVSLCLLKYNKLIYKLYDFFFFICAKLKFSFKVRESFIAWNLLLWMVSTILWFWIRAQWTTLSITDLLVWYVYIKNFRYYQ